MENTKVVLDELIDFRANMENINIIFDELIYFIAKNRKHKGCSWWIGIFQSKQGKHKGRPWWIDRFQSKHAKHTQKKTWWTSHIQIGHAVRVNYASDRQVEKTSSVWTVFWLLLVLFETGRLISKVVSELISYWLETPRYAAVEITSCRESGWLDNLLDIQL